MAFDNLIEVAKVGNLQQMALLVKAGQDVNQQEPKELTTPLYWAACCGQEAACDWLIRNGADINQRVKWQSTPLHAAADRENMNCTILLVRSGAKLNIQNNNGDTPLHKAAYRGNVRICNVLLHGGASVTLQNAQNKTPKAEAQSRKHYYVFKLLTKWENDAHLLCKMGDTHCCQYSMSANTAHLTASPATPLVRAISISEPIPPTRANISPPVHRPVQESFCCFPQHQPEVETAANIKDPRCFGDVELRTSDRSTSEMSYALQYGLQSACNGGHVELVPCEGHSENAGQDQQSANQKVAENSDGRKEDNQRKRPEGTQTQLEEYVLQLQVKLTEKIDRIEKLEKDRRQVISGLTKFRNSMAEQQKENIELRKHVEKMEQKYSAIQEEMTAVKVHNHHMAMELDKLREMLDSRCDTMTTPQTSGDLLSSDDFLAKINPSRSAAFSKKFLARGASSPELTALSEKAETVADVRGYCDLYSATLPVFRSIDQLCLVNITAKLTQQLTARSLLWNQHVLLDIPGRPWQQGGDYVVIDGLPIPYAQDPEKELPSRFSLRICHKDKNYILKICKNKEESSSGRCECSVPPHQNVVPTLHSYDGSLLTLHPSHDAPPVNFTDYKATFTIIPNYTVSLNNFFSEHRKRHPHPPFRLPLRFYLHLLFELLMVALHLERQLVEKCLDMSDIFLDDHLQVKFSETACSLLRGGRSCGTDEHSEDTKETEETQDDTNVNRIGQFFFNLICYQSDEFVTTTSQLSWLPAKFSSIILGMLSREETLSSREAFVRVGLLLFGPKSNDITCLLDCEIWLQTRMLILLSRKHQKMSGVTTVAESIIHNDPQLEAEFLRYVTAGEVWTHHTEL